MRPAPAWLILGLALAAAACSRPVDHEVAFYRAHPADRATQLATCRNDQGRVAATPNCINALAADSEATSRRFWTVPKPAARVSGDRL